MVLVSVDHCPREVNGANDQLHTAEPPEGEKGTMAFVGIYPSAAHVSGQTRQIRRKWHDEVMIARLILVLKISLRSFAMTA
jgi:hypothetical protein